MIYNKVVVMNALHNFAVDKFWIENIYSTENSF